MKVGFPEASLLRRVPVMTLKVLPGGIRYTAIALPGKSCGLRTSVGNSTLDVYCDLQ